MFAQASAQGSPPRMRGKVHQLREAAQFGGITPAYAGKRWTRLPSRAAMRDHPRVCGEKTAEQFKAEYPQGSPPRMRGKAQSYGSGSCPHRITPAYAGKSEVPGWAAETAEDHPRVCGEKTEKIPMTPELKGSPPRMRGKDNQTASAANSTGITPAYAGKSHCHPGQCGRNGDHPRVCGEKTKKIP